MSTLSFKGLNKIYPNKVQAVFDFNLEIQDKEFIVFVGPSGCGKSTTLRMVAGLESITSGELYIDGKLVNDVDPKDRDIAMVFQNYALYPHMSVYNNMAYALRLRRAEMPLYEEDTPEILEIIEKNKGIKKSIKAINRQFKKKQDSVELMQQRESLYRELYANVDKINSLRKPIIGRDEFHIGKLEKTLEYLKKDVSDFDELSKTKYAGDTEKVKILQEGIAQRQGKIAEVEKELEYLKNNDVPLCKVRHLTAEEIDIEINKISSSIDLTKYLFRKPSELSGGQRQRVALGRAIVRKPKVFLMDEPLSNLDAKLRVQTRSEITKIHERVGATTIYVTHDQTEAMTMADRIVIMKDGYVQQIGTPKEVYDDPANAFVGGFIGAPGMNFIDVTVKGNAITVNQIKDEDNSILAKNTRYGDVIFTLTEKDAKALAPYEGKTVVLGVRPEDVYVKGNKNNEHPSEAVEAVCDFSELLGSELVLYSYVNGQKFVGKGSSKMNVETNQEFAFCLDLEKLYFFDKESGERIK